MGLIRLLFFGFIGLSVIHVLISIYSRSVRREKLEDEWDEAHPDQPGSAERDAFIEAGMIEYQTGIRPKLIGLVYVVPTVLVVAILILTN
ncbi:MAG: hypothetical protein CSA73_01440 [Rhodobacterales bacterium]|nr:MAG: hypothetical protein CSA73_01440 [Rhodobacterales bacterium]